MQSIRTLAGLEIEVPLADPAGDALYQRISEEAAHLRRLGWTYAEIARRFGVNKTTAARAVRWADECCPRGRLAVKYMEVAEDAQALAAEGLSVNAIAKRLGVSWHVAKSAVLGRWVRATAHTRREQLNLLDED